MSGNIPSPPEDVSGASGVDKTKGFDKESPIKPNQEEFQSYMNEAPSAGQQAQAAQGPSPMEITQSAQPQGSVSIESILSQTNNTEGLFNTIKNNLNTPNLKLKRSHQKLLDNKLKDAKRYIDSASGKLGVQVFPETKISDKNGPIAKFLSYITDGQKQIVAVKEKVAQLAKENKKITPGDMLMVQVKLSQAQQEMEYASILLSKVVDALKQTLNIQI